MNLSEYMCVYAFDRNIFRNYRMIYVCLHVVLTIGLIRKLRFDLKEIYLTFVIHESEKKEINQMQINMHNLCCIK